MKSPTVLTDFNDYEIGFYDLESEYHVTRPNGSSTYLLFFTIQGEGFIKSNNSTIQIDSNKIVIVPPRIPQEYGLLDNNSSWKFFWVHFNIEPQWLDFFPFRGNTNLIQHIYIDKDRFYRKIKHCLQQCLTSQQQRSPLSIYFSKHFFEQALLWIAQKETGGKNIEYDERLQKICEYISMNLSSDLSTNRLSEIASLSTSRLSHLFKENLQQPIQQYIEAQRMSLAKSLLKNTSLTINQIAEKTGFSTQFYFTNRFKKFQNQTPSEYRRKHR